MEKYSKIWLLNIVPRKHGGLIGTGEKFIVELIQWWRWRKSEFNGNVYEAVNVIEYILL